MEREQIIHEFALQAAMAVIQHEYGKNPDMLSSKAIDIMVDTYKNAANTFDVLKDIPTFADAEN